MAVIDKNMYEELKKWCHWDEKSRPKNQRIMYVNCHDRAITNATIRKLMFEMYKEDKHGELYCAFYSAGNFYRNMRDYYTHIAGLYCRKPDEETELIDIIRDIPSTCSWITLIVGDCEKLSFEPEKVEEMIKTFISFGCRGASIILIGDGDYKEVFRESEYALREMEKGLAAEEEERRIMIRSYMQEKDPIREDVIYETTEKQRDELTFYWNCLYKQLENDYFDYEDYKYLYKQTMEYIIPRVTKERVYRNDLILIEKVGAMTNKQKDNFDGCTPWEMKAAQEFAMGLHDAIVNRCGDNNDLSKGKIEMNLMIRSPSTHHGGFHSDGYLCGTIGIRVDEVCREMDELSDSIHEYTYNGNIDRAMRFLDDWEC